MLHDKPNITNLNAKMNALIFGRKTASEKDKNKLNDVSLFILFY